MKTTGYDVLDAVAATVMADASLDVAAVRSLDARAHIRIDTTAVETMGLAARPRLHMTGAVECVTGDFPHGIDTVTFDDPTREPMAVDAMYTFDNDQLSKLALKGLWTEDWPRVDTAPRYFDVPVTCDAVIAVPDPFDPKRAPFVFVDVRGRSTFAWTKDTPGIGDVVESMPDMPGNDTMKASTRQNGADVSVTDAYKDKEPVEASVSIPDEVKDVPQTDASQEEDIGSRKSDDPHTLYASAIMPMIGKAAEALVAAARRDRTPASALGDAMDAATVHKGTDVQADAPADAAQAPVAPPADAVDVAPAEPVAPAPLEAAPAPIDLEAERRRRRDAAARKADARKAQRAAQARAEAESEVREAAQAADGAWDDDDAWGDDAWDRSR